MPSDFRELLTRCRACLRSLDLPDPFSVEALCASIEGKRGRSLKLLPLTSNGGPFGLLVTSQRVDYIFFAQDTTPLHQRHIVLHELCHVLLGHRSPIIPESELLQWLLPDLKPSLVEAMLRRRSYSATDEQEAELLASLILERIGSSSPVVSPPNDFESASLLARLEATLREPPREVR